MKTLIECPNCHKMLTDNLAACPKCGRLITDLESDVGSEAELETNQEPEAVPEPAPAPAADTKPAPEDNAAASAPETIEAPASAEFFDRLGSAVDSIKDKLALGAVSAEIAGLFGDIRTALSGEFVGNDKTGMMDKLSELRAAMNDCAEFIGGRLAELDETRRLLEDNSSEETGKGSGTSEEAAYGEDEFAEERVRTDFEKLKDAKAGDRILFGSCMQEFDPDAGFRAIEWLVLDSEPGRIFVVSSCALEVLQYNAVDKSVTWRASTLRSFLNSGFMDLVFAPEERERIISVIVAADKNRVYKTLPGGTTTDKVFLLSSSDVERYFGSRLDSKCPDSDYCHARGSVRNAGGYCPWWLRTPGRYGNFASVVLDDGRISDDGLKVDSETVAVRPAMWISV